MAWLYLVLASTADVVWTSLLKAFSFSKPPIFVLAVLINMTVPFFVAYALKTIPLGTAYAIWMGLAAAGAFVAGAVLFNEPVTFGRIFCVLLILAGIIGLKYLEGNSPHL